MSAILTMSGFLFPLITFPYASRIITVEGIGRVSFATSIVTYFSMFAQLGIPTYGIRTCAKVRDNKEELSRTVQEILIINLVMTALVYVVFLFSVFYIPRLRQEKALFLILSVLILLNAIGVEWLYRALEKFSYITACSIIFKTIALIGMFLLVHRFEDYVIYGGISIFAASASGVMNFINLRKQITLKPVGNYNFKRHIKMILTFFSMSIATTIYTNLDTVMLGFMKTDTDVGYYNAAVKIKSILVSVVTAISTVLLPRVSYFIEKNLLEEFWKIIKKTIYFVLIISLPMTIYFMLFAKEGILFLSGEGYQGSILPMQIIMPTLVFIGLTNILGIQMMVPMNKEIYVLYSEIAGALVDLVINIALIPSMGAAGAAIGTVVAELTVLIYQYYVLRKEVRKIFIDIKYWALVIGVTLAAFGSVWVKMLHLSNFITLVCSAIIFFTIYAIALIILRVPMAKELVKELADKIRSKVKNVSH